MVHEVKGKDGLQIQLASANQKLVVIDFTAKWCGPCQQIAPLFESLSHKYKGTVFLKVDVDECSDISGDYDVRAMPTFVFLKSGKEVGRVRGADPGAIEKNIVNLGGNETFVGQGMTLGGKGSDTSTSSGGFLSSVGNLLGFGGAGAGLPTQDSQANLENEEIAKAMLQIDESKPTANIQIRLANGAKLKTKVNLNHTIQQIREFVTLSRPEYAEKAFSLITTHPTKELSDETLTVDAAQIANTMIVQKLG